MKKITIVIVGNTHAKGMRFSIDKTLENTPHVESVLQIGNVPLGYGRHIDLKNDFSLEDYNYFMIKNLWAFVKTEFALIIQYDGIAANKNAWTDDYFNYDYIGAPWPDHFSWIEKSEKVGNGGFSLRSARLLECLKDSHIKFEDSPRLKNEDAVICQGYSSFLRKKYNIKYAPVDIANSFSHEWCNPTGETFGFHGVWNFPLFFDEKICIEHLLSVPKSHWYNDKIAMLKYNCEKRDYKNLWNTICDKVLLA